MQPPMWLARLAHDGSVPRSLVTRDGEGQLAQLRVLGLASEVVQGSRRRIVARNIPALQAWVAAAYPPTDQSPLPGLRATNIARTRRSKSGVATHAAQPLLLRWFEPGALLAELTERLGVVGVTTDRIGALRPPADWTLLTVENWESFLATTSRGTIIVAYAGGNIAETAIQALAAIQPPAHALHFGDYDWAGLAIFRRIRLHIPSIRLYIPDNIDELFKRFAAPELLGGQTPLTTRADDTPEAQRIISLIARHNAGLEQEIVPPPTLL